MLRSLVMFSLRFRLIVVLLAVILLVGGIVSLRDADWDVFPEFAPPQIVVQTEAAGLSTEEVEQLVTVPVEAALNGVGRLKVLRSSSAAGLSVTTAIFEDGTDILTARQLVGERIGEVATKLPQGTGPPRMTPLTASTSRLLMVALTSKTVSPMDLRTLADWTFKRRLEAVQGVAKVEVFGGAVKQFQVLLDPLRMRSFGVSLQEVGQAARNATGYGGASFLETPNQRVAIRQRTRIETPDDLAAVPITVTRGLPIALRQVADVAIGVEDRVGDALVDGKPAVLMVIHKQPYFNTLTVTDNLSGALDELRGGLPADVELHENLFRQATFIERAMHNLNLAILIGCALVVLVLAAFLAQWRTVVISLTAIPLSLLGAILVLRAFGASLNSMTLGGLAIALGEVVDDAIVDVENVLRRLRENARRPRPLSAFRVILKASLEVRGAVVYASFIVMLVFLPVFLLPGLAGSFFRPLGYAYVVAILVSLVVAMTLTPALCYLLLRRYGEPRDDGRYRADDDSALVRFLKRAYGRVLPVLLTHPKATLGAALLVAGAAVGLAPFLGGEFLPEFRESNFVVLMAGKPDSSLVEAERTGKLIYDRLAAFPGVESVAQQIGRAELSEDTWGPNVSEIWVELDEDIDYENLLSAVRDDLEDVPGLVFEIKPFLRERIDETLTGATADVVIRVAGPDLAELRAIAQKIHDAIEDVAGLEDLRVEQQVAVPQLEILSRPAELARFGVTAGELNQTVRTLLAGAHVGQIYDQDRVFDVVVRAPPAARSNAAAIGELLVDLPTNEKVPLRALADINLVDSPNAINREGASRRTQITFNVEGRDLSAVVAEIRDRIERQVEPLPAGYHMEFAGEYAARMEAVARLVLFGGLSLVGIFALLYLDFRSVRQALLVMLSVPLAGIGGVFAVAATGGSVSLGTLVGFVTLFGIAVRNGILLISHFQHLAAIDGMPWGPALIVRGATERLAPILMTSAATGLALLPLIVAGNRPGHEIEFPMAVVIVGGLTSSVLLTLGLLPVLCSWAMRGDAEPETTEPPTAHTP